MRVDALLCLVQHLVGGARPAPNKSRRIHRGEGATPTRDMFFRATSKQRFLLRLASRALSDVLAIVS